MEHEFKPWNNEEIDNYTRNFNKGKIGPAYLHAGIRLNEPHKRVEYLIKRLNLPEERIKSIIKKLEEDDPSSIEKPFLLKSLEDSAINNFY